MLYNVINVVISFASVTIPKETGIWSLIITVELDDILMTLPIGN